MIGNLFIKFLMYAIFLIDWRNRYKIKKFFQNEFKKKQIIILDIGAHKGETIDLFYKNLNIDKIYSFEPNKNLFDILKTNKKYQKDNIKVYNFGFGEIPETKKLNIYKDTSSSTLNYLNENTEYFKRKKKFMSFFFNNQNYLIEKQNVKICNLSKFLQSESISKVDILKIDTEGYEFNILKGLSDSDFKKIRFLYFEHHYDLMINKGYNISDITKLLIKNNFKKKYKLRMKFRKSFEYIYENSN